MAEIIFKTEDVTKVYDTGDVKVYALDNVPLEPFKGELTVLLGPLGSGDVCFNKLGPQRG